MTSPWQAILPPEPTVPESAASLAEEAGTALERNVVTALPDYSVIDVTGADAAPFLQGQLTNSVDRLSDGDAPLAAWCSAKGRVTALFRVLRIPTGYRLLLPADIAADTVRRLKLFVLRSDVRIEDVSDAHAVMGLSGPACAELLAEDVASTPTAPDSAIHAGDLILVRLRSPDCRFLFLVPAGQAGEQWRFVSRGHTIVSANAWRLLAIRDGRPSVAASARDRFVPQMLNLEALGGLRYDKGCYPGQEVVARMHYLGRLKRRMYRVLAAAPRRLQDGEPVRDAEGTEAGEVVQAAVGPTGASEALAVLRIDAAEGETPLFIGDAPVEIASLPYDVPGG